MEAGTLWIYYLSSIRHRSLRYFLGHVSWAVYIRYLSGELIRRILLGGGPKEVWSKRATAEIAQAIEETNCVAKDGLVFEVDRDKGQTRWWTFAGLLANSQLADAFGSCGGRADNLTVTMSKALLPADIRTPLDTNMTGLGAPSVDHDDLVKFQECVPPQLLAEMLVSRTSDKEAVDATCTARMIFRDMT